MRYEVKLNAIEKNWDIVMGYKEIIKGMLEQKFAEKMAKELNKAYDQGYAAIENENQKINEAMKKLFY